MAARLAMRRYDCRNRTPCFLASRVSPLIAACKSFASVGKVMFLGCTVVSTVTRAKSFVRSAPLSCATRKLSARRSSSELHQLAPHVDDLVQLRAEQITRSCRLVLLRPHRSLRYGDRITLLDSRESRKRNCKLPAPQTLKPCNLKSPKPPENNSRSEA